MLLYSFVLIFKYVVLNTKVVTSKSCTHSVIASPSTPKEVLKKFKKDISAKTFNKITDASVYPNVNFFFQLKKI